MNRILSTMLVGLLLGLLVACGSPAAAVPTAVPTAAPTEPPAPPTATPAPAATVTPAQAGFALTSGAFAAEGAIPAVHSCRGENRSPALAWTAPPEGTQSLALVMDDPDAAGFVHWVVFNLPPEAGELPEGLPPDAALPGGALQGTGTDNDEGYFGPCPPSGTHRYVFTLYALDTTLDLEAGARRRQLVAAMEGHILAETQLVGTFGE